jgi:hypothetical protein
MSWNYSGDPRLSSRDAVRFNIQDVNEDDQQFSNEEIRFLLDQYPDQIYTVCLILAERLVAKYARRVDKSVGDLHISYGSTVKTYQDMMNTMRIRASLEAGAPYCGGMAESDRLLDSSDDSLVQPTFRKGMHDRQLPATDMSPGENVPLTGAGGT